MSKIVDPGIYNLTSEQYHADPCPVASLSNSIAKVLLDQSPLHARFRHPRLNIDRTDDSKPTKPMQKGSALHRLILGKGADIAHLPFRDYKSKIAREERDAAQAEGKIVLLEYEYEAVLACAEAARDQLMKREDCAAFFGQGQSEAVIAWRERDIWCRGMVDFLPDDPRAPLFDLKGTTKSASPQEWSRSLAREYRTQDRFYARGMKAIRGITPEPMRFIVVEMNAPYAVSVLTPAPSLRHVADENVSRAIRIWSECMKSGEWPGYPHMAHVEAPAWLINEQEEQEIRDDILAEFGDAA
ncbi:PD-(D/E)XK nuclease-like domain-containing protein [Bombella sp. TMW 2.2559]|uniref:PD-(D/E)XK nuclease-like domain-containing protein n=1 Tax=Bombella dulcis TaxID=2967339 RepID=A0ABT3WA90_9PROT|nr:PD-(D/E)XK nuclease-like domain-containing protein [Bombella dulcis]MCX5616017.1 PD-(D/E)XK nuclease-like domain-containing protein [Bombella dulcis]